MFNVKNIKVLLGDVQMNLYYLERYPSTRGVVWDATRWDLPTNSMKSVYSKCYIPKD